MAEGLIAGVRKVFSGTRNKYIRVARQRLPVAGGPRKNLAHSCCTVLSTRRVVKQLIVLRLLDALMQIFFDVIFAVFDRALFWLDAEAIE